MKNLFLLSVLFLIAFQSCSNLFNSDFEECTSDCFTFQGIAIDKNNGKVVSNNDIVLKCDQGSNIFILPKMIMESQTDENGFFAISVSDSVYLNCNNQRLVFSNGGSELEGYEPGSFKIPSFDIEANIDKVIDLEEIEVYHFTRSTIIINSNINQTIFSASFRVRAVVDGEFIDTYNHNESLGSEYELNEGPNEIDMGLLSDYNNKIEFSYKLEQNGADFNEEELIYITRFENARPSFIID